MNMVDVFIKEIHSVEPYDDNHVKVDMTVDVEMNIERVTRVFDIDQWGWIYKRMKYAE